MVVSLKKDCTLDKFLLHCRPRLLAPSSFREKYISDVCFIMRLSETCQGDDNDTGLTTLEFSKICANSQCIRYAGHK